jgi:uncharacterized protein YecE (DUF72 family)
MHWIGTSGFQYPEWKEKFYPADLSTKKMLSYYGERFTSTEVNYSFRRIPSRETLARWHDSTPKTFKFSFKAPQRITHFARLVDCNEILEAFIGALSTMNEKLGVVLFQLPPQFKKDTARLGTFLNIIPAKVRSAFEFRDPSWFDEEIYGLLRRHNCALCIAESEDLATPPVSTADFGYMRLRREDYKPSQLKKWAAFLCEQGDWSDSFIYFKHEERAVGPKFAERFTRLLRGVKSSR